jgi:hypothetical protein
MKMLHVLDDAQPRFFIIAASHVSEFNVLDPFRSNHSDFL